ncbi:Flp family type IVb pilin [Caenibius sp. WL]|uniref:Flp family type IVb pilin n=1 Tax=Caenibius sp. WL TaxID=2872646 RepID=UPI001C9991BF|nr:Flp family type IVb pilin [Caenibius sp. WL]QZP07289.1 Flp family type IVb pilin [Caenibius sp. WL]
MKFFQSVLRDESGATAIEYGLIAALVAVAAIAAMSFLGGELTNLFNGVGNELSDATTNLDTSAGTTTGTTTGG